MIRFIDVMRDRFGVELVWRTMRAAEVGFVTARGYRAAKSRSVSARTLSDQVIGGETVRLHAENHGVFGIRKMHLPLKRLGWEIGRDQTARIMRAHQKDDRDGPRQASAAHAHEIRSDKGSTWFHPLKG